MKKDAHTGTPFIYTGTSMQPKFKPGQLLYVSPILRDLTLGDVIIFQGRTKDDYVVHRVVRMQKNKIFTRGDNNPVEDPDPITPDQVLGIIRSADYNGSFAVVRGGRIGYFYLRFQSTLSAIKGWLLRIFYPFYALLKASKFLPKIWHPEVTKIFVNSKNGNLVKFIHRGRVVATWYTTSNTFICRKPYNLVIPSPIEKQ